MKEKSLKSSAATIFLRFIPFWIFLVFFKFGGGLHYSLVSPFGEKLLPLWVIGFLMGGCSLVQLALDVPAGYMLDRFGYRKLLTVGTFIFLFAALLYTFGLTLETYLLSLIISTFGWLFFGPGINAYILSQAPKKHAGSFISLRDVFGSVGIVLSSATLPFFILLSPQKLGVAIFILLLIALIAICFSPKDEHPIQKAKKIPTQEHYIRRRFLSQTLRDIKKLNPASTLLVLLELSGATFYGSIWFVVPLVIAHQADAKLLGIGLGMFDFAIVVLGFFLGKLSDRANKRTLVFFGLLLFALAGMVLGFNFGWLFLLFGFLATSGDEMAGISLWSWLHSLDKNHASDGAVSGVINLFQDLGWAIGPIVAGIFYQIAGPTWTLVICAMPILITWITYSFMVEHQPVNSIPFHTIPKKPHKRRSKI